MKLCKQLFLKELDDVPMFRTIGIRGIQLKEKRRLLAPAFPNSYHIVLGILQ
jgi:hypothetical protein